MFTTNMTNECKQGLCMFCIADQLQTDNQLRRYITKKQNEESIFLSVSVRYSKDSKGRRGMHWFPRRLLVFVPASLEFIIYDKLLSSSRARSRSSLKHIFLMEGASQLHFASFVSRARTRIIVIIWVCRALCVCERVRKIVWISRRRRSSLH